MSTEETKQLRSRLGFAVIAMALASGLLVGGYLMPAEWLDALRAVIPAVR